MIATLRKMLGIVRKVFGCLARLWLCVIQAVCRGKRYESGGNHGDQRQRSSTGNTLDNMNWDAEGWDEFSVTVVPNVAEGAEQLPQQSGESDEQSRDKPDVEEDLFQDMKPVFRKPQKIHLHSKSSEQQNVNLSKFAVQDSVFRQELAGELGTWNEDDGREGGGWEDEGDLVTDSQHILRMKRASEREKRRKAQEAMRSQQRTSSGTSNLRLGTRVT